MGFGVNSLLFFRSLLAMYPHTTLTWTLRMMIKMMMTTWRWWWTWVFVTLVMIVAPREDNFLVPNIILYTTLTLNESIVFSLYVMS